MTQPILELYIQFGNKFRLLVVQFISSFIYSERSLSWSFCTFKGMTDISMNTVCTVISAIIKVNTDWREVQSQKKMEQIRNHHRRANSRAVISKISRYLEIQEKVKRRSFQINARAEMKSWSSATAHVFRDLQVFCVAGACSR